MCLYDYECEKCGKVEEVFHSILETPKIVCACGGACKRLIGYSRFILKGDNWAADGYSKKTQTKTDE